MLLSEFLCLCARREFSGKGRVLLRNICKTLGLGYEKRGAGDRLHTPHSFRKSSPHLGGAVFEKFRSFKLLF